MEVKTSKTFLITLTESEAKELSDYFDGRSGAYGIAHDIMVKLDKELDDDPWA